MLTATALALPFLAGVLALGDHRGPAFYPRGLHQFIYLLGWETAAREGKPRSPFPPTSRPLFWMP